MDPWPSPVRTICLNFDRGGYESSRYGTLSNISPKHYPNVKKTMTVLSLTRTNMNNRQCSGWFLVLSLNEGFHKWSGVPPVLIIFFWRFSVKSTIQLLGYPHDYGKPLQMLSQPRFQNPPQALLQGRTTWAGGTGWQQLRRRPDRLRCWNIQSINGWF